MATFFADNSYMGALAFDVGEVSTRGGFAGDAEPRATFSSTIVLGLPPALAGNGAQWGTIEDDAHLSDTTVSGLDARPLYPEGASQSDDWVLARLLEHGLCRLGCNTWSEHPLILSEFTGASPTARRQTAEIVFEELGAPALCVVRAAELAGISAGRPTAVVIEAGEAVTTASCTIDGVVAPRSVCQSKLGGTLARQLFCAQAVAPTVGKLVPACLLRGATGGAGGSVKCLESYERFRFTELQRALFESAARCSEAAAAPPAPPAPSHCRRRELVRCRPH